MVPRRISFVSLLIGGWEFWRRKWWATLVTAAAAGVASLLLGVGLHAVLQSIGVAVFVAVATVWRTDYPFRLSTVEFSSFQAYRNTCSLFGRMGIVERTPA